MHSFFFWMKNFLSQVPYVCSSLSVELGSLLLHCAFPNLQDLHSDV